MRRRSERYGLADKHWTSTSELIEERILILLESLVKDLEVDPDAIMGDAITEPLFYKPRITLLCSLVSAYAIWMRLRKQDGGARIDFCRSFLLENHKKSILWGEGAVPQFLCQYWYLKCIDSSPAPDLMLGSVLDVLCRLNRFGSTQTLPSPYYDVQDIVCARVGVPGCEIDDSFAGESYTSESLMHLFVRLMWKQNARLLWPGYTKVRNCHIDFNEVWSNYMWRVSGSGVPRSAWPKRKKEWGELRSEACECAGEGVPLLLKKRPHLFPLFLIVYPHRCTSEFVRWLDSYLWNALW